MGYVIFPEGISRKHSNQLLLGHDFWAKPESNHIPMLCATDVIYRDPEGSVSEPSVLVIFVKQEDLSGQQPSGKLT